MKKIAITENLDIKTVFDKTKQIFPELKVIKRGKKYIFVKDKAVMTAIKKRKSSLRLYSDINMKHPKIYIPMIIGVLIGIIGVILVIAGLYIYYTKKRKMLRKEVYLKLNNEFGT